MAKDVEAGGAFVRLGLRSNLKKGLRAAGASLKRFGKVAAGAAASVAAIGAAAGTALVGAAKKFADAGREIDILSKRTRVSGEALQGLGHAARSVGSDADTMAAALAEMNLRAGEAATGVGAAYDALNLLGISVEEFNAMPTEEKLYTISDALAGLEDRDLAQFLGDELFGGDFETLAPLIMEGADAMKEAAAEAERLGLVMSEADKEGAAELSKAFGTLSQQFGAIVQQIGSAVAPMLTALLEKIQPIITKVIEWIDTNKAMVRDVETAWQTITNIVDIYANAMAVGLLQTWLDVKNAFFDMVNSMVGAWFDFSEKINQGALRIMNVLGIISDQTYEIAKADLARERAAAKVNAQQKVQNAQLNATKGTTDAIAAAQEQLALSMEKFSKDREAAIAKQEEAREKARKDFQEFAADVAGGVNPFAAAQEAENAAVGAFGGVGLSSLQRTEPTQEEIRDAVQKTVDLIEELIEVTKATAPEFVA